MNISVIIPTYNGSYLLKRNINSLIEALREYEYEVIIIDNGSSDNTEDVVKEFGTKLKYIKLEKNFGFSIASNRGVKLSKFEYLLFLNNDVKVTKGFLKPLLDDLEEDVFSVSSLEIIDEKTNCCKGPSYGIFKLGIVEHDNLFTKVKKIENKCEIFCPDGGCFLTTKKKFQELNGFLEIYSPFYWEDIDLGYRAWKKGWKNLFEPKSIVYHNHESTSKKLPQSFVKTISEKNKFLFHWINLTEPKKLICHISLIPLRSILQLAKLNFSYFKGFFMAIFKLKQVIKIRRFNARFQKLSDNDILEKNWLDQ